MRAGGIIMCVYSTVGTRQYKMHASLPGLASARFFLFLMLKRELAGLPDLVPGPVRKTEGEVGHQDTDQRQLHQDI